MQVASPFELWKVVHKSGDKDSEVKANIKSEPFIGKLVELLSDFTDSRTRFQTCDLIAHLASSDPAFCVKVTSNPALLERLIFLLHPSDRRSMLAAAATLALCAASSDAAGPLLAERQQFLSTLSAMSGWASDPDARAWAVGTLHALSRNPDCRRRLAVKEVLCALNDTLSRAGARLERVAAALALVHLSRDPDPAAASPQLLPAIAEALPLLDPIHVGAGTTPRGRAVRRLLQDPAVSVLAALLRLAGAAEGRAALVEMGLLPRLGRAIAGGGTTGPEGAERRRLAVAVAAELAEEAGLRRAMRGARPFQACTRGVRA